MMADFGEKVVATVCVLTDQRALAYLIAKALGRRGIKMSSTSGLQHEVKEGKLNVKKVGTNNTPADLLTNAMNVEKVTKYMADVGLDIDNSRANTAPTLQRTTISLAASRSKLGDHNANIEAEVGLC